MDGVNDVEASGSTPKPVTWQPPALDLVVCESLEDEARRSASQKSDAELAEMHAIATRAHAEATRGRGREGEADYWDVLLRAIVAEAARRPDFGQSEPEDGEPRGRRRRRRRRKRLEALIAARETELAGPAETP